MAILDTYKAGNTMMQTATKLGVKLDRVRDVILKNNAGRMTPFDKAYLNTLEHAPGVPNRRK